MRHVPDPSHSIETEGLCRRYGRRWALVDVTLQIGRGAAVMVGGRNGSGKSTLLRLLATAIRPDRGSILVEGFSVAEEKDEVRRRVALLSHASYLYEALSALENLQVVARHLGKAWAADDLMPLLARVRLDSRAHDAVSTFSAGMRKRLSIARVLLQEPSIVLLDEPYGALDPPGFALVDQLIRDFHARGATVLMATHQLERAVSLCDQGVILDEGRIVASGPSAEIVERARVALEDEGGAAWS